MTTDLTALTHLLTEATERYERIVEMHTAANRLGIDMLEAGLDPATADAAAKVLDTERDAALGLLIETTTKIREAEDERVKIDEDTTVVLGTDAMGVEVRGHMSDICCTYLCGGCINGEICGATVDRVRYGASAQNDTVATCEHRAPTEECAQLAG